jgi:hypothetical protein
MVHLISGLHARLFEVEVALDTVHGLVADHALIPASQSENAPVTTAAMAIR